MTQNLINEVISIIKEKSRFLITSHVDPDGDSIGSQIALYRALRHFGKEVAIVNEGAMPSKYKFLDPDGNVKFDSTALEFVPEAVFIIECPLLDRIGSVIDLIPETAVRINIDHHPDNEEYADINLIDAESSAVGETLYLIFEAANIELDREIASSLYAAIVSDTGRFRFRSTTSRSMLIASKLIDRGADPKTISDKIFSDYSPATLRLLGLTLSGLQLDSEGRIGYMIIGREDLRKTGADMENSEGFVDLILSVPGIYLGFMFKEISENKIKVSVRSQNGCDAADFARLFDGGGHVNAAGFSVDGSLDEVISRVMARAREFVKT